MKQVSKKHLIPLQGTFRVQSSMIFALFQEKHVKTGVPKTATALTECATAILVIQEQIAVKQYALFLGATIILPQIHV